MAGIFKAYDIRGLYPDEINETLTYKIGRAFAKFIGAGKTVVLGRDMRPSSEILFKLLVEGLTDGGLTVINIGLISTPMFNFATAYYGYDGGLIITASHNPKEYNGIKMCLKNAIPINYDTGIQEIEAFVDTDDITVKTAQKGSCFSKDILDDYTAHVLTFKNHIKNFKIVIDAGNGMAGATIPSVFKFIGCDIIPLYFELDGTFPNHDANPLKSENMIELQQTVLQHKADLGAAFDGDADRVMFVDNQGNLVSSDIITALIAEAFLKKNPHSTILYDLRSSRIVPETITSMDGIAHMCRVGHAFIKKQLRDEDGIFAGELSGHFYFRDNFYTDSGIIALLMVLNLLSSTDKTFSEYLKPLQKYYASGEINSFVTDKDEKLQQIEKKYNDGNKISHLDGLLVEYSDWWFNLRKSNTEPLLRLNVEANTLPNMEQKRNELLEQITE
ncbi:phosphomannomutase/phosphoglucomutase [Chlamydiota bacterium]